MEKQDCTDYQDDMKSGVFESWFKTKIAAEKHVQVRFGVQILPIF